jgi:iron complex transport system substrate-binding protein
MFRVMRMRKTLSGLVMLTGLIVLLAPGTAISARVPAAAQRIVSVIPAVTEMLFAMGAGDAVVGVSSYDHYPAAVESRTRVGGLIDPNFERIVTLKPDLVIVYGTQQEFIAKLEQAHVPIYRYEHAALADVTATVRAIGQRIGRADAGNALAGAMERDLDAVRRQVAGDRRLKTLLLFGRDKSSLRSINASGGYGFLHDLLDVAGGDDVFADVKKQSVQTNAEQVLARAPEAIIELHESITPAEMTQARSLWSVLGTVPAVRNGRVHFLTGEYLTIPGPRVAQAARAIAEALHPSVRK